MAGMSSGRAATVSPLVHDQLAAHSFQLFLPMIESWFRRGGAQRLGRVPLFRGYLFLRHAMDKESYLQVCKIRGLLRIRGSIRDRAGREGMQRPPAGKLRSVYSRW